MDSFRATVVAFHENASTTHTNVPALVSAQIPQTLPAKEVLGLCQTMREAVPFSANRNSVICFTGAGNNEIISTVALEAASAAASQVNLRVLLIDAVATKDPNREPLLSSLRATLHGAIKMELPITDAMTTVRGTHLSYTCLSQEGQGEAAISIIGALRKLLEEMRTSYDLIVIDAGSVMTGALSMELVKMSDGAVMVIEAERTRAPVAQRAKDMIETAGGRVIGAVLGNRRHHIPTALYKWL